MPERRGVSLNPDKHTSESLNLYETITKLNNDNIDPQTATRSSRDSLRVSHGLTIEGLPIALECIQEAYKLPSLVTTTQYATYAVCLLMRHNPVSAECMLLYDSSLSKARRSNLFRDLRDNGTHYSIRHIAVRGITIWAFNDKIANSIDSMSRKLGLFSAHAAQIFLCGVLAECHDALEIRQIKELSGEYKSGLSKIAVYAHNLKFDDAEYLT